MFTLAIDNRKTIIDRALSDIYANKSENINQGLFDLYFNNYRKAIAQVFPNVKPGHALFDRVDQFRLNAARMAANKSYKQTQILFDQATNADAILDRLVHTSHRIELKGESLRRKK